MALKTPWRDGTVGIVLTAIQLVAKLAALVARPGQNLIRYHGVVGSVQIDAVRVTVREPGLGTWDTQARDTGVGACALATGVVAPAAAVRTAVQVDTFVAALGKIDGEAGRDAVRGVEE